MKSTTSKLRFFCAFYMRAMFALLTAIFVLAIGGRADGPDHDVYNYTYTGAVQTFTVPAGITSISVDAYGASGTTIDPSQGNYDSQLGKGGRVLANLTVTPGDTLNIYVGEAPHDEEWSSGAGGWNGGGGGMLDRGGTFPGGGATDIRIGGTGLNNRVIVAGGGGGKRNGSTYGGGHGGGLVGQNGGGGNNSYSGPRYGAGGSQSSGGAGGYSYVGSTYYIRASSIGTLGNGGNGDTDSGGGGGGYYGGGGGADGGGGGGSSYTDPTLSSSVVHTQGVQIGSGQLTITVTQGDGPDAI
ncbi:MAG: hypothetical protein HN607_05815, partial [Verrucomicrobia bacterium]|nr:hypothetical protein [Verrucomicrobiota bacterium]